MVKRVVALILSIVGMLGYSRTVSGEPSADTKLWGAISASAWKNVPVTQGRVATENDVQQGRAVFYVATGSTPIIMELPVAAILKEDNNSKGIPVIVIQAEQIGEQETVGYRLVAGGNGVCTLRELELLDAPDDRFN
jgi:hypothetical protein